MSERARGKNHPPPGTPPRKRRVPKPGRNRPAKNYDAKLEQRVALNVNEEPHE